MMDVPVLMTNCHVSKYWNNGPVMPHTVTILAAVINTAVEPESLVIALAIRPKKAPGGEFFGRFIAVR